MSDLRILLIEESPSETPLTRAILTKAGGSDVDVCYGIEQAKASHLPHDVALLDLGAATSTGPDPVTRFRAHWPRMPLVVLTPDDLEENLRAAIRRGADECLVKFDATPRTLRRAMLLAIARQTPRKRPKEVDAFVSRLGGASEGIAVLFQHAHEQVLSRCVAGGIDATSFHFVDLTQRGDDGLVAPPGVSFIGSPVQLEKATMRVFQACRTMQAPTVFIDSVETLTLYNGPRVAAEFLDGLSRRLALAGHNFNALGGPSQTV